MKRGLVESIATERVLAALNADAVGLFLDAETSDESRVSEPFGVQIKQVCAKVPKQLADDLNGCADLLGMSRRRLFEAAIVDCVAKCREVIEKEGYADRLRAVVSEMPPAGPSAVLRSA